MRLIFIVTASLLTLAQKTAADPPSAETKSFTDKLLNFFSWNSTPKPTEQRSCRRHECFNEDCRDCFLYMYYGITVEVTSRPRLPRAESTKVTPSDRIKQLIESREKHSMIETVDQARILALIDQDIEAETRLLNGIGQNKNTGMPTNITKPSTPAPSTRDYRYHFTQNIGLKLDGNSFVFTEWRQADTAEPKESAMKGRKFTYDKERPESRRWCDEQKEFYMDEDATHFINADGKAVATKLSAMQAPLSVPLGSPSRTKGNPHRIGEEKYHWHLYLGDGSDGSTTVLVKIKQERNVPEGLKCDGNSFVFTKWLQVDTGKPHERTMSGRKFTYDAARKENRRWCDADGKFYMNEDAKHFYNHAGKTVAVKRSATIAKGSKKLEPGSPAQEDHWLLHRGDNGDASMTDKVTIEPDFQDRRRRLGVSPVLAALTEEIQQAQCHQ
jgi:hypothetical protein